jgi:uncharacterized protein YozE (UPF0346 family)
LVEKLFCFLNSADFEISIDYDKSAEFLEKSAEFLEKFAEFLGKYAEFLENLQNFLNFCRIS